MVGSHEASYTWIIGEQFQVLNPRSDNLHIFLRGEVIGCFLTSRIDRDVNCELFDRHLARIITIGNNQRSSSNCTTHTYV